MSTRSIFVVGSLGGLLLGAPPAFAAAPCPEGRTISGECVVPDLAQMMRRQSILLAQPKISYTAPPILPSGDRSYYIPTQFHEINNLFTFPPVTGVFTTRPRP